MHASLSGPGRPRSASAAVARAGSACDRVGVHDPWLPFHRLGPPQSVPGWSRDFDAWATEALERGDLDELSAFRTRLPRDAVCAPHGRALHPDVPDARGRQRIRRYRRRRRSTDGCTACHGGRSRWPETRASSAAAGQSWLRRASASVTSSRPAARSARIAPVSTSGPVAGLATSGPVGSPRPTSSTASRCGCRNRPPDPRLGYVSLDGQDRGRHCAERHSCRLLAVGKVHVFRTKTRTMWTASSTGWRRRLSGFRGATASRAARSSPGRPTRPRLNRRSSPGCATPCPEHPHPVFPSGRTRRLWGLRESPVLFGPVGDDGRRRRGRVGEPENDVTRPWAVCPARHAPAPVVY